jgi:hypothetical protein
MEDILKSAGAILGVIAFLWKVWDEYASFLRISLQSGASKGRFASVTSCVSNPGLRAKKIYFAFLLVSPEAESPLQTANAILAATGATEQLNCTNDLLKLKDILANTGPIIAKYHGALIPLPFFYSEQLRIGDETLSYSTPIDTKFLKKGVPYSVRLFVFPLRRLHRSTQALLVR